MASTACQSVPVGTSNYYSAWSVRNTAGSAVRIQSIRLVDTATSSPSIHLLGYYVQAKGGASLFGESWGATEISGTARKTFVNLTGLRPPSGVLIKASSMVNLAVALKVDGLGVSRWKGMDVTYASGGRTVTQRIDPAMAIYGVPSMKSDDECPDE